METVNLVIHPKDPMLRQPRGEAEIAQYFRIGKNGLDAIKRVLMFSRNSGVQRILDLPSGFGRVARHLRAGFPDAEIDFCDLNTEMADFCAKQFSGAALHSQEELTQIEFSKPYEVIWVGSLFTHVDCDRVKRWMSHLCSALRDDGVLVATFHGAWSFEYHRKFPMCAGDEWEEIVAGYNSVGFGYSPYRSRGIHSVGISLSKPSAVVQLVEGMDGVRLVSYTERGWANFHDVLGVTKRDRMLPEPGWDKVPYVK